MPVTVTVATEARFLATPDGSIWSEFGVDARFWLRYLRVFDEVRVLARVRSAPCVPPHFKRSDDERVRFVRLPYYVGPSQYLRHSRALSDIIGTAVRHADAVLLRVPGQIGSIAYAHLRKAGKPFGVEVVGDPHDVFAPGAVRHPLRALFRLIGSERLRVQCRSAAGAAYVTSNALQRRYPNTNYSTSYSSIDLDDAAFAPEPRRRFGSGGVFRLIFVGSLEQLYKAPDILVEAIALCRSRGLNLTLRFIGDGRLRSNLEELVVARGLSQYVTFLGQLRSGETVREQLINSDLFVLPSRTEGLPRAMIEAMACALPCVGSCAGGIPELLIGDDLVPVGDAVRLANKIDEIISSQGRMSAMSGRNLLKSQDFRRAALDARRDEFYRYLRDAAYPPRRA